MDGPRLAEALGICGVTRETEEYEPAQHFFDEPAGLEAASSALREISDLSLCFASPKSETTEEEPTETVMPEAVPQEEASGGGKRLLDIAQKAAPLMRDTGNCVYYNCTAFFSNTTKDIAALVHRHNGVSLFRGSPAKLCAQFCFHEPEYLIELAVYDDIYNVLALCFARPDHEKAVLLDLATSREKTIYSSTRPSETIVNMCFHEDGSHLLITTQ